VEEYRKILDNLLLKYIKGVSGIMHQLFNRTRKKKLSQAFTLRARNSKSKLEPKSNDYIEVVTLNKPIIDGTKGPMTDEEKRLVGRFNGELVKLSERSEVSATLGLPLSNIIPSMIKIITGSHNLVKNVTSLLVDRRQRIYNLVKSTRLESLSNDGVEPSELQLKEDRKHPYTKEEWKNALDIISEKKEINNILIQTFGSDNVSDVNWEEVVLIAKSRA